MARVLPPIKFRFHEADWEQYGDDWRTFDELQLAELRRRDLVAIEAELKAELGLRNIIVALESFLHGDTVGSIAVMWMALRIAGEPVKLADFDPLPMKVDHEIVKPDAEPEADADPPAESSSDSPASDPEE
jgi:hypothetical protein